MKTLTATAAVGLMVGCLPLAGAVAQAPQGLRPAEPVVCYGSQDLVLRERYIKTPGDGVVVSGNCDVRIVDSRIEAGGVGIQVSGNGDVELIGSSVSGGRLGVVASGNGALSCHDSDIEGGTSVSGNAELSDRGCRGIAAGYADADDIGDVEVDLGTISVGPGGVVIEQGGDRVSVGAGGVRVESGGESVVVDGDFVRLRTSDTEAEVAGDWRIVADSRYSAADTSRLIVELGGTAEGSDLRLRLAGDVLFDFDSAAIRPDAAEELAKVAHVIRQRATGEITVTGHTDSIGSDAYNQELSERRSVAVMRWLSDRAGIPAALMRGRGMGSRQPLVHNTKPDGSDDPEGRARNRRVEIGFISAEPAATGRGRIEVGPGVVRVGGAAGDSAGDVTVTSEGVSIGRAAAGAAVDVASAPRGDLSAACRELCRIWDGMDDATSECATVLLELRGYPVVGEPVCVGVDTPTHCRLCAAKLGLDDGDCEAVARRCL